MATRPIGIRGAVVMIDETTVVDMMTVVVIEAIGGIAATQGAEATIVTTVTAAKMIVVSVTMTGQGMGKSAIHLVSSRTTSVDELKFNIM
jgi:hypothetical protein